jgi:serine/threonine-protein kinase
MSLQPGARLSAYEILGLIGAGGMGEVYRARDTKLHREVALKVLPARFALDPDRLARFQREAQVLASLNHPNIAIIHGLEESDGVRALVLELVEGPTLADRITQGAIPFDEALPIARQVADALEAAHGHGVIHRDLKPANIKVKADGTVKVLDFGLAKAMEPTGAMSPGLSMSPTLSLQATQAGMILGTAGYMSPEQVRGKSIDFRTDIFSLGAVFYEMLTGRRAYDRPSIVETMGAVLKDDPAKYPESDKIPESIRGFVFRSLEKDPADRYQSATDLLMDLRAYQAEQRHDAAERVQFRAEPPWKHRRTRVLLRAVGGILLFLLGFFAGSCWERRGVPVRTSGPRVAFPTGRPPVYAEATAESSAPATTGRAPARSFGSGIGAAQHASPHAS